MGALLHHCAGKQYRVLGESNRGNRACCHCFAVHDRRIEFVDAVEGKDRTFASVEIFVILQDNDGSGNRVQCTATFFEYFRTGIERSSQAGTGGRIFLWRDLVTRHDTGTAVNEQGPFLLGDHCLLLGMIVRPRMGGQRCAEA